MTAMGLADNRGHPLTVPDTQTAWKGKVVPSQPTSTAGTGASGTGNFGSILSDAAAADEPLKAAAPAYFRDLNLDQLVDAVLLGREDYDLAGYFFTPLTDLRAVAYRQAVALEVDRDEVRTALAAFGRDMVEVRRRLAQARNARFDLQRQAWHLAGTVVYTDAVDRLAETLDALALSSAGLTGFRGYLAGYVESSRFRHLRQEAHQARAGLDGVAYRLQLQAGRVVVSLPQDEDDYTDDVFATFARFRQGTAKEYRVRLDSAAELNHVEEEIALRVAKLLPGPFDALHRFSAEHSEPVDDTLARFDREVQVYLAWVEFTARMRQAGLPLCYPRVTREMTPVRVEQAWDATLAAKLSPQGHAVVTNDIDAEGDERIWVVTGPNQGGKTTWSRTVGQVAYLASLGLAIPGREGTVPLCDQILTHFERGEDSADLTGKLDDDLTRMHDLLQQATSSSLLVVNEIFTSTSAADAAWLSTQVMGEIAELGCLCVWVTFLDELTTLERTVSLVAGIDPDDPGRRTFRVARRPADGRAYADALAVRYRLDPASLTERLPS